MKGDITLKILEIVGETVVNTIDLVGAILSSGYGASYGKIQYELSRRQSDREIKSFRKKIYNQNKQKYYNLIYKLKRDNLIKENTEKNKKYFVLTEKGESKLFDLLARRKNKFPENIYNKENGNNLIIVAFDIPEIEKRKREWVRAALKNLDFKMIQKSVWVGKVKIPKQFLDDLLKLRLIDFVEIFEVSKSGSLKHII